MGVDMASENEAAIIVGVVMGTIATIFSAWVTKRPLLCDPIQDADQHGASQVDAASSLAVISE